MVAITIVSAGISCRPPTPGHLPRAIDVTRARAELPEVGLHAPRRPTPPSMPAVIRIVERWPPPDSIVLVINDTLLRELGRDHDADSLVFEAIRSRCIVSIQLERGPRVTARYGDLRGRHALMLRVVEPNSMGACPR